MRQSAPKRPEPIAGAATIILPQDNRCHSHAVGITLLRESPQGYVSILDAATGK